MKNKPKPKENRSNTYAKIPILKGSFLKKSIDRKKFSSSNVLSYDKILQKNAWASLLQFAGVTMPHLPHVFNLVVSKFY